VVLRFCEIFLVAKTHHFSSLRSVLLQQHLWLMSDFDFQPYRDFILLDGDKQGALYTPTDALLPLQVGTIAQREQRNQTEFSPRVEQLPVLEGLRKYALGDKREHVILAGRPGSGKSTALQQLRSTLAAEGFVPVLVRLKGDRSVPEMIQGEFRRAQQKVSLEQIDDWLLADRLVLLLDGVNEIPTDDLRRSLADFREQNTTVPMIFTTRDLAVGGDFGIKQRLQMKPLTETQMREFVWQHLKVNGGDLLGQLGDRLREIAETPLLLKMLCDVFGQTGQIPESKGELFRLFDQEYDKFKKLPPVSEDFRRFKSEILQHLAFVMMTGDSSKPTEFWLTVDKRIAEREIEKFLIDRVSDPAAKAKEWIENSKNHYLLQDAGDSEQLEFHHQLFQEYYAAEKLFGMLHDDHPYVIDEQRFQHFYLNYLKWTEVISIGISLVKDESIALKVVRLAFNVDLALGWNLSTLLPISMKSVKFVMDELNLNARDLQLPKIYLDKSSRDLLQQKKDCHDIDYDLMHLMEMINEEENGSPEVDAVTLDTYKDNQEVISKIETILGDQAYSEELRSWAIKNMLRLGYSVPDSHIEIILASENSSSVATIVEVIGSGELHQFVPQLLQLLAEGDYIVASAVIPSLLKISPSSASSTIKEYLLELDSEYVEFDNFEKFQANNRFLGYLLIDLNNTPHLINGIVIPSLYNMCSESSLAEAFEAISDTNSRKTDQWISTTELLARHGHKPAIDVILHAVSLYQEEEVFHEALQCVKRLHLREAIPKLISILEQHSPLEYKTYLTAETLCVFKDPSTLTLISSLRDCAARSTEDPGSTYYQILSRRIQETHGFYNYDIFCSPPPQTQSTSQTPSKIIVHGDLVVGDKYDNVGNLNTGTVNIAGNQTGETK
jgi:DNA polymerase III delta prime subunit